MIKYLIVLTITNLAVFGGGGIYISVFENIFVQMFSYMNEFEYASLVAFNNIFPGLIGGKLAAYGGYLTGGYLGAITATIVFLLVPTLVVVLLFKSVDIIKNHPLYQQLNNDLKPVIIGSFFAIGITFLRLGSTNMNLLFAGCYFLVSLILIKKFKVPVVWLVLIAMVVNYIIFIGW